MNSVSAWKLKPVCFFKQTQLIPATVKLPFDSGNLCCTVVKDQCSVVLQEE